MTITTNRHWRPFLYRYDVPDRVLQEDFDYLAEEDALDGFLRYRGSWYHLSEFLRLPPTGRLRSTGWTGVYALHAFASVVLQIGDDPSYYQIGLATS